MIDDSVISKVIERLRRRADYEYFFGRISSPDWIEPLRRIGFFARPESIRRKGEVIQIPAWPESQYLARVAGKAPDLVMDVILDIPETSNPRILEDYITACLVMPAVVGARIVSKLEGWSLEERALLLPGRLGDLAVHLANGGEASAALRVLRKLLQGESGGVSSWESREVLKNLVAEMPDSLQIPLLGLLCSVLPEHFEADVTRPEDFSFIWRPAIEDHRQNLMSERRDHLVTAIRDLAELVVARESANLAEIVNLLERQEWIVFRRLALHLIRKAGPHGEAMARARLVNVEIGGNPDLHHEYVLLLRDWFPHLEPSEQEAILARVTEGLEIERWKEVSARNLGRDPTEEEEKQRTAYYFVQHLAPFADSLPPDWKTRYEDWLRVAGPAEHPEFLGYHRTGWIGPTSPMSEDDLRQMEVSEIADFLRTWEPQRGLGQPSAEGLGRALAAATQEDPARFAAAAESFTGLDPTYICSLLAAFAQTVRVGRSFDWVPVLFLCEWVLAQPRNGAPQTDADSLEPHPGWGWARTEIGRLLNEAFETITDAGLPFALRDAAFRVLAELSDDPDPSLEGEAKDAKAVVTDSMNSTRGVAMNAVVRYAIWVWRQTKDDAPWTFDRVPEVREVLDRRLDPAVEPTSAIRAVYGVWLPNLVALDRAWVQKSLDRIFPKDQELRRLREAAWSAFIVYSHPYTDVFDLLVEEYRLAVERLAPTDPSPTGLADQGLRLAQHLMVFFWRGKVSMGSADGLIPLFFSRASDPLRSEALEFIGRSLREEDADVPTDMRDRLKHLWEWRMASAESDRTVPAREEVTAFGSWFASGRFDPAWAIEQLLRALTVSRKAEPEHWVMERLAIDKEAFPIQVVRSLELLVEGDTEGWRVMNWRNEMRAILRSVLASENQDARGVAADLVHKLGARGYFAFGDLLAGVGS